MFPNKDSNKCKAFPIKHFLHHIGGTAGRLKPTQLDSAKVELNLAHCTYTEDFLCISNMLGLVILVDGKRIWFWLGHAYIQGEQRIERDRTDSGE